MVGLTSVTGLASGIDTKAIIDALINADRASTAVEETRKNVLQAKLDAVRAFNTRLSALDDALTPLRTQTVFGTLKASSGNEASITATASIAAVAGTYDLRVVALAQSHQLTTTQMASPTASNGAGSLVVQLLGGTATTLALTDTSLNGIAATVNAAHLGLTASVINDGTGNRLLVRSQNTGLANQILAFNATDGSDPSLKALLPGGSTGPTTLTVVAAAADAQLRIGDPNTGLLVTRPGNTIADLIAGVTLDLKATTTTATAITVAKDNGTVKDAVKAMVKSYNDAIGYLDDNAKFDATTGKAGPLIGDSDLSRGLNGVLDALTGAVAGAPAQMNSLYAIGLSIDQATGQLSLDETVFDAQLASNPDGMKTLLSGAAAAAHNQVTAMTDGGYGSVTLKTTYLQDSIQTITDQIAKADARLALRRQRYEAQFSAMETMISSLKNQSNQLTTFFNSLQTTKSSSSA